MTSTELPTVILASASATRAQILHNAGVPFTTAVAGVDESAIKASMQQDSADARAVAEALAELKALRVSQRRPDALVIGADQVLVCNGEFFDKPTDRMQARATLAALRNRPHDLVSAVVVARAGAPIWRHVDVAHLHMRAFSDAFIDDYLSQVGDQALTSVGAYQVEGHGIQLFARITGDHFTILGLPLLSLLDFLRDHGVLTR